MKNERKNGRKVPKGHRLLPTLPHCMKRGSICGQCFGAQSHIQHCFVFIEQADTHDLPVAALASFSKSGCHPIWGSFAASKFAKAWKLPHVMALGMIWPSRTLSSDSVSVSRSCPWAIAEG